MLKHDLNDIILVEAVKILIFDCGDYNKKESLLILSDYKTCEIGEFFLLVLSSLHINASHLILPVAKVHGQEPNEETSKKMLGSDLIVGLTTFSLAHTTSRINASKNGSKYLSLPDNSWESLRSDALRENFRDLTDEANEIANQLSSASKIKIITNDEFELCCNIQGRVANAAPGWCYNKGVLASPPDAEVNITPIESDTNGKYVINASITHPKLGLLTSPITIEVEHGAIKKIEGHQSSILENIFDGFDSSSRVVAEIGLGLNHKAKLTGSMLEDEGFRGSLHLGVGSNIALGGKNIASSHIDLITQNALLFADELLISLK